MYEILQKSDLPLATFKWISVKYPDLFNIDFKPSLFSFLISDNRFNLISLLINNMPLKLLSGKGKSTSLLHLLAAANNNLARTLAKICDHDLFKKDSNSLTPAELAENMGYTELATFLKVLTPSTTKLVEMPSDNESDFSFESEEIQMIVRKDSTHHSVCSEKPARFSSKFSLQPPNIVFRERSASMVISKLVLDDNSMFNNVINTLSMKIAKMLPSCIILQELYQITLKQRRIFNLNSIISISKASNFSFLTNQFESFALEMKKTKARLWKSKLVAFEEVSCVIKKINDKYDLSIFGSKASDLDIPQSDLDVLISANDDPPVGVLETIQMALKKNKQWKTNLIAQTRIPVLKLMINEVVLDLSVNTENHQGLDNVKFVDKLCSEYFWLRPSVHFIKNLMYVCNFSEPFKGGLGSYSIVLMLVHLFKNVIDYKGLPKTFAALVIIVLQFSNYYGNIYHGEVLGEEVEQNKYFTNSKLKLADPLNPSNNVGFATTRFYELQVLLSYFHIVLADKLADFTPKEDILEGVLKKVKVAAQLIEFR